MSRSSKTSDGSSSSSSSSSGHISGLGQSYFPRFLIDQFCNREKLVTDTLIEGAFFFRLPSAVLQINIEYDFSKIASYSSSSAIPISSIHGNGVANGNSSSASSTSILPGTPSSPVNVTSSSGTAMSPASSYSSLSSLPSLIPSPSPFASNDNFSFSSLPHSGPIDAKVTEKALQVVYEAILECIARLNGDVATIKGGKIVALWASSRSDEPQEALLLRAISCAMAVSRLPSVVNSAQSPLPIRLVSCAAVDTVYVLIVGGYLKWKYVTAGPAVDEVTLLSEAAANLVSPPSPLILVSPTSFNSIRDVCEGLPLESFVSPEPANANQSPTKVPMVQILAARKKISTPMSPMPGASSALSPSSSNHSSNSHHSSHSADWNRIKCLRILAARFVPEHLRQVESEHVLSRLSDMRIVSVVSAHFPSLVFTATTPKRKNKRETEDSDDSEDEDQDDREDVHETNQSLQVLQHVMNTLQVIGSRVDGCVYDTICTNEGTTVLLTFGLERVREDDAIRAVRVGVLLKRGAMLGELPSCWIGISTGRITYSPLGSQTRRDMVIIGDVTAQAQKLSKIAKAIVPPVMLICDEGTTKASEKYGRSKLKFEPVPNYKAFTLVSKSLNENQFESGAMLGRNEEIDFFECKISDLQEGQSSIILLEGEEGVGKTTLIDFVQKYAKDVDIPCYYSSGDCMEKNSPWYAWRTIFFQLWDVPLGASLEDIVPRDQVMKLTDFVAKQLASEDELRVYCCLLNAILPVHFPENDHVKKMSAVARADKIRDFLLYFLMDPTEEPRIIIIEDLQWLDSASKNFLFFAAKRIQSPVMFILTSREMINKDDNDDFLQQAKVHLPTMIHKKLKPLNENDIATLISKCLSVKILPSSVASLVYQKSQGNPFFAQEITLALHQSGALAITANGKCTPDFVALSKIVPITDSIERVITSRIDPLTVSQKRVLKIASILGTKFEFSFMRKLFPDPELNKILESLRRLNLLIVEEKNDPLVIGNSHTYSLAQSIIQVVVYASMSVVEKEEIHKQVAEYLETLASQRDDPSIYYTSLAYHWSKAKNSVLKSIKYYERAAFKTLKANAYREAIHFYSELLSIGENSEVKPGDIEIVAKARWERHLAEAYLSEGHFEKARTHLEHALSVIGYSNPSLVNKISPLRQMFRQGWSSWMPAFSSSNDFSEDNTNKSLEAVLIYELLTDVYFFENQKSALVISSIQALSLAIDTGVSGPLAVAYANMAYVTKWSSFSSLDDRYKTKAMEIAQKLGDQELVVKVALCSAMKDWITGELQKAISTLEPVVQEFEKSNRPGTRVDCFSLCTHATILLCIGQAEAALKHFEFCMRVSDSINETLTSVWSRLGETSVNLLGGNLIKAKSNLERLGQIVESEKQGMWSSSLFRIWYGGLQAALFWRLNDYASALDVCMAHQEELVECELISPMALLGLTYFAEVATGLLGAQIASKAHKQDEALETLCSDICNVLLAFSKNCRFVLPAVYLWQGITTYLLSSVSKAQQLWKKAVQEADRMSTQREKTIANRLLSSDLSSGRSASDHHKLTSCLLFVSSESS